MPVPRSDTPFCRAHVAWECALVAIDSDGDEEDGTCARDDGTYDPSSNTLICMACYTALMEVTPSGQGIDDELDFSTAILRRQGLVLSDEALVRQLRRWREEWTVIGPVVYDDDADVLSAPPPERAREPEPEPGFVYFVAAPDSGEIKIGWSGDPLKRVENLRTGSPHGMELLHVRAGDRAAERAWHARFAHLRIDGGEWFRAGSELLAAIEQDRREADAADERLQQIRERRRGRETAHRILRERGLKGPFGPAQLRIAADTHRWLRAVRGTRHFVLPWLAGDDVAMLTFGTLLEPDLTDPAERQLRDLNKQAARGHTFVAPDGELFHAPLDELTFLRPADFERAAAQGFDYAIPDLIADQLRDGFGRTLAHHDLLDWWRRAFELESGQEESAPA